VDEMKLRINGEEYPFPDPDTWTFREAGIIKRMSGVRPAELGEAFAAGDAELLAALTFITLKRAGKPVTEDQVLDMQISALAPEEPEADAGPPAEPVAQETPGDESNLTPDLNGNPSSLVSTG